MTRSGPPTNSFTRLGILPPILVALLAALLLAGCGFRGPLYLPEDEPSADESELATEVEREADEAEENEEREGEDGS